MVRLQSAPPEKKPVTFDTLLAGFSYIRHNPILLGALSLDLFAVLLGGVTALLPIYAKDVLETGPWGLGLLRSAPAIGALAVSILLAHVTLERRVGHILFASVAGFGLGAIVFAFSTSLILSIAALAVYGACDAISVVIRHTLVQMRTPNDMLGRVLAVNFMFTGSSGTLGEFRAGAVAAAFGAFASLLAGGVAILIVTALWMRLFPQLVRIEKIDPQH
jgi:MFS family permease